ncbi:MAG: polymer-forming cytoskeletal protein, partial [Proteobacteria bacterium]|nr:polymer-forming cytoskeletal protein [Pseudomonadota bacterium]
QFDGRIEGDLHCGSLTIGESAEVTGGVVADTVIIHGTLMGTIRAKRVRLERTSKVIGDVWHEDLSIESGAHIEGQFVRVENALDDSKDFEPKLKSQAIRGPGADAKNDDVPSNSTLPGFKAAVAG